METNEEIITYKTEPRTVIEILGVWSDVFGMTEKFFANELPRSSTKSTIYGLLIYTPLIALLQVIAKVIENTTQSVDYFGYIPQNDVSLTSYISTFLYAIVLIPAGFYILNGLFFASAKLFGGEGKFNDQTYLTSLFFLPFSLITAITSTLSFISCTGFINLIISIYQIVFMIRLFKIVHNFAKGRATLSVLIPNLLIVAAAILIISTLMRISF